MGLDEALNVARRMEGHFRIFENAHRVLLTVQTAEGHMKELDAKIQERAATVAEYEATIEANLKQLTEIKDGVNLFLKEREELSHEVADKRAENAKRIEADLEELKANANNKFADHTRDLANQLESLSRQVTEKAKQLELVDANLAKARESAKRIMGA